MDFAVYRKWLFECATANECELHAFVLMTNHVHLMVTGVVEGALSAMMQAMGRRYARYFNDRHERSGPLFEGRYRSSLIESDRYALACIRYIELNPVRAGMIDDATRYPWSTCGNHALGRPLPGWTPHPTYLALAARDADRAAAYRAMLVEPIPMDIVAELRWRTAHQQARARSSTQPDSTIPPAQGSGWQPGSQPGWQPDP